MNLAIEKENIEIVKLLMSHNKFDVNFPYMYLGEDSIEEKPPLYFAVEKGNIEIVKLLMSNDKLDVNIPYINDKENKIEKKNIIIFSN